ncbi:MAG: hypothetical protein HYY50_02830 [Candidatus Kerfeldbacteria bacterium]|nr:hypothetical protein [Candidatus Kerfeldbacteria bacterium]
MTGQVAKSILILVIIIIVVTADLAGIKAIPGLAVVIQPSLLLTMILTLTQGWRFGLLAALVAGGFYQLVSTFTPWAPILAFVGTATLVSFLTRRVLTTKSTMSFLSLMAIGTFGFYLILVGVAGVAYALNPHQSKPLLLMWLPPLLFQLISHPFLGWLFWRLTNRRQRLTQATTPDYQF